MRIRKIKQIIPNMSKVIGANDTPNDKDVYSSLDVKNMISGKILWTNPKPTEDFIQQDITLNNSDYETYKIYYKQSKRDNSFLISESIKGNGTKLITKTGSNYITDRDVVYISETKLRFYGAYQNDVLVNDFLIPVYIVGYKTGLFS